MWPIFLLPLCPRCVPRPPPPPPPPFSLSLPPSLLSPLRQQMAAKFGPLPWSPRRFTRTTLSLSPSSPLSPLGRAIVALPTTPTTPDQREEEEEVSTLLSLSLPLPRSLAAGCAPLGCSPLPCVCRGRATPLPPRRRRHRHLGSPGERRGGQRTLRGRGRSRGYQGHDAIGWECKRLLLR